MNIAKYDAMTIAKYIISNSHEHGLECSNLRLQKILYFVQAQFLVNTESQNPCFKEEIVAESYGPVVHEVYREYKRFGSWDIPYPYFEPKYYELPINSEDMKQINKVVKMLKHYSTTDLLEICINQKPWKEAKYCIDHKHIITNDSIKKYFTTYG